LESELIITDDIIEIFGLFLSSKDKSVTTSLLGRVVHSPHRSSQRKQFCTVCSAL